ncbi:MAG: hypothetical protein A3F72_06400 [Bacteroidetes bacterium RIFCSPLOWO2_12_FULL_35_15]|nr:MAG: hypothetical protein A3F72_06400 [Bacteroidetes bacterium RIFCSPLOWO2_12_FULL_35_15]
MNKTIINNFIFLFALLFCIDAYSQQTHVVPTKGKEFWIGFLEQADWSNSIGTKRLDVFISSKTNTSGTITIPAQGYSQSFTVTANVTTTVNIPNAIAEHLSIETIDNKGVFIQTLDTVSVYAINFQQYTADGALVLPKNSLGTEYRITGYPALNNTSYTLRSMALIVATEDNTQINITPSVNTLGGKIAGNTYTIILNSGQSYQIKGLTYSDDLTGTVIKATPQSGTCRAFAVYSGNTCVNIPNGCAYCDALFEQEYPTNIWGKNYMIPPFSFATSYTYRVLADLNGTTFSINGGAPQSLNAGQYYEANSISGPVYITANNRVSVTQFMQGSSCSGAGDPSQLAINPVDQVLTDITFSTVTSTVISSHNVNVIMKSSFTNQLRLDGTLVNPSSFLTFTPNPSYSYAQLNLSQGSHTLLADSGFVAYSYGTGQDESYAYALGSFMQETIIPTDTVYCTTSAVTLTPPEILISPQWTTASNPSVVISTGISLTVTPTTNEVYTVTGSSQQSGCPKMYHFSVEIPNPPTLTLIQSKDTICRFDNVQLNVTVLPQSSSYVYSWLPTIGLNNPNIANPIASPPQSMWYYCTVSTLNGCGRNLDSVFIDVRPGNISNVNASASQTAFCTGGSSQLNLTIENVIFQDSINPTYIPALWSSISGATASNICGSISGNAFYFNNIGSRFAATASLNVINGGTVYFHLKIANGTAPCDNAEPGEDVILEYSINGGASWITFATYIENLYPNFTFLSAPIPNLAKTAATRFRWRQLSNSGINQDNWCLDNVYIGAVDNNTSAFYWSPATDLTNATIANPVANPDSSITYYATVIDTTYGCRYVDSLLIDVGQPFSLNVTNDDTICQASGLPLFANPSLSGTYSYLWTPASTLSNNSISNPVATPVSTTLYHINVLSAQGCSAQDSVRINVPLISVFYTSPHKDSICTGQSLQLNTTYQKGCGVNGTVCGGTINTIQLGTAATTTTTNNSTIYNGTSISSRFQLLITKAELNALGINSSVTLKEIGFRIGSIAGSNIYQNFSIKMGCTSQTVLSSTFVGGLQTVFNPQNVVLSTGIDYYVLNNSYDWDGNSNVVIDVCYNNSSASANSSTYYTASSFNSFLAASSGSACNALTGTLSMNRPNIYIKYCNTPPLNNLDYLWSPSLSLNDASLSNPIATPPASTTYFLSANDSATGCVYNDSVKITVGSLFSIATADSILNCNTLGVVLSALPSQPGTYTYSWSPAGSLNNSSISNPIASPIGTTEYHVSVTSGFGCTVNDTVKVVVPSLATFYTTPPIDSICNGQSVQLTSVYQKNCGVNGSICSGASTAVQVGGGTFSSSSNSVTIYKGSYNGTRIQMLFTKAELNAAGINSAKTLKEAGFNIATISGSNIYQGFSIKMGCTSQTALTSTFQAGLQTVFNPKNVILSSGINYYVFDNTYDWDGISNIIVEICYNNSSISANSSVYYTTTTNNSVNYTTGSLVCGNATGTLSTSRANTYFKYCSAGIAGNLDFQWTPSVGLNFDTIASPIASPGMNTIYYVVATDSSTGCIFYDSVSIKTSQNIVLQLRNDTTICQGETITLNAGSGFDTYLWNDGSTDSVKTVSISGNYWVEVSNQCGTQRDSCTLIINNSLNNLDLGNDTLICSGSQVILNAFQPNYISYLWQNGSVDSNYTAAGSGLYWVTVSTECGTRSDSVTISVQAPDFIDLGNDTAICPGNTITLDAGADYNSYAWQNNSILQTFTVSAAGIYHVSATNACGVYSDSIIVSFDALPAVNLGADTTICYGDSVLINATGCANCNYTWQNGSGGLNYNANAAGQYYISASNGCGIDNDSIIVFTQDPTPVDLGNDTSLCGGNTFTLDAGANYNSYAWQNNSVLQTFIVSASGIYHVTTTNACGVYSDSITVSFDALPSVNLGADTTICYGDSVFLNATGCANCNYTWQNGSGGLNYNANVAGLYYISASNGCGIDKDSIIIFTQIPTPVDIGNDTTLCPGNMLNLDAGADYNSYEWQNSSVLQTFNVSIAGIYHVSATNACGVYSDSITVSFDSLPAINLGADLIICSGDSILLNAIGCPNCNYTWQNGSGGSDYNATTAGLYYISASNECGIDKDSLVIFTQTPNPVDLGNDTSLCAGNTFNLDAGADYNSYQWQNNSVLQTFSVSVSGTYYVSATNACGAYSDSITVSFDVLPSVNLGADQTICSGDSILLNAVGCTNCNYTWQNGSNGLNYTATAAGIYYVSASTNCGLAIDSIQLNPMNLPSVSLRPDTTICVGDFVTVTAQYDVNSQYLWQNGSASNSITANSAGAYWVTVTNYCGTVADTFKIISVHPQPIINLGIDTLLCENDTIRLDAFHSGYTYLWQDNSIGSDNMATSAGIYWVTVTDLNNCRSRDSILLSILQKPFINMGPDKTICIGDEDRIDLPINSSTYQWQNGSTNNYFIVRDTGLYSVTAINSCGSYKDSIRFMEAECNCNVDLPTAFSPNGDGANDMLFLRGSCVVNINLYIYDRWGQKVFESHDLANGWDGTFNGKKLDTAVFAFYLSAQSNYDKDKKIVKKGNISLIR